MAYHSQDGKREEVFTSNQEPDTTGTISLNFDAAQDLIAQGGRVLKEIEEGHVLPAGEPIDLMFTGPR
jgi:hypothetical protein